MRKLFRREKLFIIIPLVIIAILAFGGLVMVLWNNILPTVLGVKMITYQQALGILVLSKILFGGFKGRGGWRGNPEMWKYRMEMNEKWATMTPEEREKFKARLKSRCGGRWGDMNREETTSEESKG